MICRVIPSAAIDLPTEINRVGVVILQFLGVGIAAIIVLNQTQASWYKVAMVLPGDISLLNVWDDLALGVQVMLSLRAFRRALVAPMLFQFEV